MLLLGALVAMVVFALPNASDCAEACGRACPGDPVTTVCQQRCRLTCYWTRGKKSASQLAAGELKLPRGGKKVRVGEMEIVTPEVGIGVAEFVEVARSLKAPRMKHRKAKAERIDLRPRMVRYGVRIENQGSTETCMAHALTSAMEFALGAQFAKDPAAARRVGAPLRGVNLSRKHAYSLSRHAAGLCSRKHRGSWVLSAASRIHDEGTYLERHWPWSLWDPRSTKWKTCIEAAQGGAPRPGADTKRHFFIDAFGYLPPVGWSSATARDVADLEGILETGHPIVLSVMFIRESFDRAWRQGGYVKMPAEGARPDGSHYVLLTGYDRPKKRLLFANSWGTRFGQAGYGSIDYAYVKRFGVEGLVVRSMRVAAP